MLLRNNRNKMNATEYKAYHELYMQNNTGSTAYHTFFAILPTVLFTLISLHATSGLKINENLKRFVIEYTIIIFPLIFGATILADYYYIINGFALFLVYIIIIKYFNTDVFLKCLEGDNVFSNTKLDCINNFRALIYLITVFSILAVDFKIFPKYLAKTETVGFSLMDTGVGLFMISSGLVHKHSQTLNIGRHIKENIQICILGVSRLCFVREFNYQEHITEYGTHWNFFFTLAICKLVSVIVLHFIGPKNALKAGLGLLFLHETLLYLYLKDWVLNTTDRSTLLNANREGLVSCSGYIALYIMSVYLKIVLTDATVKRKHVVLKLILYSYFLWLFVCVFNKIMPASRVLANTAYCTFIFALGLTFVTMFFLLEIYMIEKKKKFSENIDNDIETSTCPDLLMLINENGLIYFLIGNLFTGFVNMAYQTLLMGTLDSLLILNCYMFFTIICLLFLN